MKNDSKMGFAAYIVIIREVVTTEPIFLTVFRILSMLGKGYLLKVFFIKALQLTYNFILMLHA